jgi:hypothetical protein
MHVPARKSRLLRWSLETDIEFTSEEQFKAYRSHCTVREFRERMHKEFTTRQIFGFVISDASPHRGHGHSIEEGGKS